MPHKRGEGQYLPLGLDQGLAIISVKSQRVNTLGFVGNTVCAADTQLCQESSHRSYGK